MVCIPVWLVVVSKGSHKAGEIQEAMSSHIHGRWVWPPRRPAAAAAEEDRPAMPTRPAPGPAVAAAEEEESEDQRAAAAAFRWYFFARWAVAAADSRAVLRGTQPAISRATQTQSTSRVRYCTMPHCMDAPAAHLFAHPGQPETFVLCRNISCDHANTQGPTVYGHITGQLLMCMMSCTCSEARRFLLFTI